MDDDPLIVIVVIVATFFSLQKEIIRQHNSILAGNLRYWEVVSHENQQYFFNHCGMTKPVFLLLLRKLTSEMGQLCDGTKIGAGCRAKNYDIPKYYSWKYVQGYI